MRPRPWKQTGQCESLHDGEHRMFYVVVFKVIYLCSLNSKTGGVCVCD